jgi:hypothetical protein
VREGVAVVLLGDVPNRLRDHGPRQRRPERVALVVGVGPHRVQAERGELVSRVHHVLLDAECLGRLAGLDELGVRLADVDRHPDDLVVAVLRFQQRYAHRGVQSAREGECHAFHRTHSQSTDGIKFIVINYARKRRTSGWARRQSG